MVFEIIFIYLLSAIQRILQDMLSIPFFFILA